MTIGLPDFNRTFEYENNFYLSCKPQRIGKLLAHYELYKLASKLPGAIVECGVFKGTSLVRWAKFRELIAEETCQQIVGFDVFGKFPEATLKKDIKQRKDYLDAAGDESISVDQMRDVLEHYGLGKNVGLVEGDILKTVPQYVKDHPEFKIAMLVVDVDIYEPTKAVLENFYPFVVPGGVVVLDDHFVWEGATKAAEEYLDKGVKLRNFPVSPTPTYFIKE